MSDKKDVPAIEGWWTEEEGALRLLGTRCRACGTFVFPKETEFCRNPACDGVDFEAVPLSPTGTLWSFTGNSYQPPPPYVCPGEVFAPFAVAAVALEAEQMVVLGMVPARFSTDDLRVGMPMALCLEPLYEDDEHRYMVWKWQPAAGEVRS